jgi:predicted patatin/cPLA2 family phospholipase
MTMKKKLSRVALVVEGGGMRGIFAAGVLDVFMEKQFDPFDLYIGVSAGACNLASHLAGQHRRNFRIYTRLMTRPDFISLKKFLRGGHMMDLDYLWDVIDAEDPLAVKEIFKMRDKEYIIVATDIEGGKPVYIKPDADNCNICLKASSAVPLLYRGNLEVNSVHCVDGGVTDPIPAREAYLRGARNIAVVRTRPAEFRKKKGMENYLSSFATRQWPKLSKAVKNQADTYSSCVDFILDPPRDVTVIQIAPEEPLKSGRTTQEIESLLADYDTGRRAGEAFMALWT